MSHVTKPKYFQVMKKYGTEKHTKMNSRELTVWKWHMSNYTRRYNSFLRDSLAQGALKRRLWPLIFSLTLVIVIVNLTPVYIESVRAKELWRPAIFFLAGSICSFLRGSLGDRAPTTSKDLKLGTSPGIKLARTSPYTLLVGNLRKTAALCSVCNLIESKFLSKASRVRNFSSTTSKYWTKQLSIVGERRDFSAPHDGDVELKREVIQTFLKSKGINERIFATTNSCFDFYRKPMFHLFHYQPQTWGSPCAVV